MSIFWNKRTAGLSPYIPGEQPRGRAFIKLNTNENPRPPSPKVIDAIREVLAGDAGSEADGIAGSALRLYPDPLCTEFREAAAAVYGIRPEQVFPGNGSDEVLAFAFGAFFESAENGTKPVFPPGSRFLPVLFPDITYSFYPVYAGLWNIPYRTPLLADDFSINPADYCGPSGGAVISNPNAPTGRVLPAEELLAIASALEKNHKVLIVDEAYAGFGAESLAPHLKDHPNLLLVHTLSKSASLAGLRVGFAMGNEALIEGLFRIRDSFNSYTMDRLALAGGRAALLDRDYYAAVNRNVAETRERTAAALSALGFTVIPSKANFLFVSAAGNMGGAELLSALRERGFLVRHFNKPRTAAYLRVSIGTDKEMDAFITACGDIIR